MPSKSKAQQRFMGLVHAFNKGDVKGSEVSKAVKDAAKSMKKKDTKKYASTKHKGLPNKVKSEAFDKIKEMIRMELEGCGYTMSAVNPKYKLKSPGGTGEQDRKLKEKIKNTEAGFRWNQIPNRGTINFGEYGKYLILNKTKMFVDGKYISGRLKGKKVRWYSKDGQKDARKRKGIPISKTPRFPYVMVKESILSEGEKETIEKLLVKYGNTPEDAKQMVRKTYDYIKKAYRKANASKKAEIMSGLMKFETTEQFSNLVEKCWKGYMIHPKRKTKKLFGKTYPNCIKKEDTLYIEAMSAAQAKAAHKKFKETGELPPHLKKLVKDLDKVKVKYKVKNIVVPGLEWMADIKEYMNTQDKKRKRKGLEPIEGFASAAQRRAAFASGYKAKGKKKKKNESIIESIINEIASYKQFVKYMNDFYGPKGIYPDKKKRTLKMKDIGTAYSVLLKKKPDFEIGYDSTDREMLRDILIKMRKLDPDYSQKKESVSEAMDKRQGAETLRQLGGNRFIAMTGAKHFGVGPNGMSFKIGRNSKRVNHVTIDYDRGRDLYNMKFDWVTIKGIQNKKKLKGIYADQLQDMFTKYTGMYTSL
tara:strand:- start:281 stop:2044 length:1764 start_codon:yes stop_codon:yes gene_type:complete